MFRDALRVAPSLSERTNQNSPDVGPLNVCRTLQKVGTAEHRLEEQK